MEPGAQTLVLKEGLGQCGHSEQSEDPNAPEPPGTGIGGGIAHTGGQGAGAGTVLGDVLHVWLLVLHSHNQRGCSVEAATVFKFFGRITVALVVLVLFRLYRVRHVL